MNYVVKVTNSSRHGHRSELGDGRVQNTMIYSDPRNDITNDVIFNLNRTYKATSGPAPKALRTGTGRRPTPRGRRQLS